MTSSTAIVGAKKGYYAIGSKWAWSVGEVASRADRLADWGNHLKLHVLGQGSYEKRGPFDQSELFHLLRMRVYFKLVTINDNFRKGEI